MGKVIYTDDRTRDTLCFNCAVLVASGPTNTSQHAINACATEGDEHYDTYVCKKCGRPIY